MIETSLISSIQFGYWIPVRFRH